MTNAKCNKLFHDFTPNVTGQKLTLNIQLFTACSNCVVTRTGLESGERLCLDMDDIAKTVPGVCQCLLPPYIRLSNISCRGLVVAAVITQYRGLAVATVTRGQSNLTKGRIVAPKIRAIL